MKKYFLTLLVACLVSHHTIGTGNKVQTKESSKRNFDKLEKPEDQKEISDFSEPLPKRAKVFAIPTYDCTFKHILTDDEVRLDFIRTFTNRSNIISTEKLDESLTPLKEFEDLRHVFGNKDNIKFLDWVNDYGSQITISGPAPSGEGVCMAPIGVQFLRDLSHHRENLSHIFPKARNSQLDVICKLENGDYAMVEIQVAKQDYWDKRALAYLASVYGRQLREGGKWCDLKRVTGINILVGGENHVPEWQSEEPNKPAKSVRHYMFQDIHNKSNYIPEMQLIQYSLGNALLDEDTFKDRKELKNWIDCLANAHKKQSIPEDASEGLKKAYKMLETKNMSATMKKRYNEEMLKLSNFQDHMEVVKKQGIAEGIEQGQKKEKYEMALKMLKKYQKKEKKYQGKEQQKYRKKYKVKIKNITGLTLEEIEFVKPFNLSTH